MATKLKEVDAVVVGLGWTGGILGRELAEAGLKVVALERGAMRSTDKDFAVPYIRDELRYVVRHDLMQNTARDTLTIRNNPSQEALPMRRLGSFLPGEVVGGSGVHWSGHTWRWTDMEFKVRSLYEERYGRNFIPADMTIADWGITYAELEPYYEKFERVAAVSGKAGNLRGQIVPGGFRSKDRGRTSMPFRRWPPSFRGRCLRQPRKTAAIIRFRVRARTPLAPTPIRTALTSAHASTAAIASVLAARRTPKAART
jgi:choline dehydrogenase-like flavoprotein